MTETKKPKTKSPRNPFVIPARSKKGGPMKNRKDKRAKENKHPDHTKEN
jgi:hypothetical protein